MTIAPSEPRLKGRVARVAAASPRMRDLLATYHREPKSGWENDAACRVADPSLFAPADTTGGDIRQSIADEARAVANHTEAARRFCSRCDVVEECLAEALVREREGTWGGERFTSLDWEAGRAVKKEMDL